MGAGLVLGTTRWGSGVSVKKGCAKLGDVNRSISTDGLRQGRVDLFWFVFNVV